MSIPNYYTKDYNTKKASTGALELPLTTRGTSIFPLEIEEIARVKPQDLTRDGGKIYRLNLDGSIPKDNPFVNNDKNRKAIFSYGHRNPQGMITHPKTGEIWVHEHGPRGGDEINVIKKGKNYGWPIITYGINYSGTPITDITEKEGA